MIRVGTLLLMLACAAPVPAAPFPEVVWLDAIAEDSLAESGLLGRIVNFVAGGRDHDRIALPFGVQIDGDHYFVLSRRTNNLVAINRRTQKAKELKIGDGGLVSPVAIVGSPDRYYLSDPEQGTVFAGDGDHLEPFLTAEQGLVRPTGLAWDRVRDRLWVVDTGGHRVYCFSPDGTLVTTLGGRGNGDTMLNYPTFIAVTPDGAVIVNDTMNGRIKKWYADGRFAWSSADLLTSEDPLGRAKGIAIDAAGRAYVVDNMEDRVIVFDTDGAILGSFGGPGTGDGQLWSPVGIAVAGDTVAVADTQNHRLALFSIAAEGAR